MGDRASIHFVRNQEESVIVYTHHSASNFLKIAERTLANLQYARGRDGDCTPLSRGEPDAVVAAFIQRAYEFPSLRVMANCEMNKNEDDAGHWVGNLDEFTLTKA